MNDEEIDRKIRETVGKIVPELVSKELKRKELEEKQAYFESEDFRSLKGDLAEMANNIGVHYDWNNHNIQAIVNEKLFQLSRRGFSKDHTRWPNERTTLITTIKNNS